MFDFPTPLDTARIARHSRIKFTLFQLIPLNEQNKILRQ